MKITTVPIWSLKNNADKLPISMHHATLKLGEQKAFLI